MTRSKDYLRAGDWVRVKSPTEIARTLNEDGTLDGLPFMPEMLPFCGKRFRVARRAEKACVEFPTRYWLREFRNNDVVFLEELRCSGVAHDGCGRACLLFWKTAWLDKVEIGLPTTQGSDNTQHALCLKTMSTSNRYFCQSTELASATQPLTRKRIVQKCLYDLASRSRGPFEIMRLILLPLWRKATYKIPRSRLVGTLRKTPVGNLELQPGDWVTIKTRTDIAQTLDSRGRNRGLLCDWGMTKYSGNKFRVRGRLERMISESTGTMRSVDSTVILEGLECLCWNVIGGCPRRELMYWREIWLDRVPGDESGKSGCRGADTCKARSAGPGDVTPVSN